MWAQFFLAYFFVLAIVYIPGFFILSATRLSRVACVCCAPFVSVAVYAMLAIIYDIAQIPASFLSIVVPVTVEGVALYSRVFLGRRRYTQPLKIDNGINKNGDTKSDEYKEAIRWHRSDGHYIVWYAGIGFILVCVIFCTSLVTPDSFSQLSDNWFHLGCVRFFLETNDYSSLNTLLYQPQAGDFASPYLNQSTFYPCAWHELVALACSTLGIPITVGVHAVNALAIGTIFPLSLCIFMNTIFSRQPAVVMLGAVFVSAFGAYPWSFMTTGPLSPNLLSYSLMLAVASTFIWCVRASNMRDRLRSGVLFVTGCCALTFAQPNGIFTMAVLLAPFCVMEIYHRVHAIRESKRLARRAAFGAALLVCAVWGICLELPLLRGVTSFYWGKTTEPLQAIFNILTIQIPPDTMEPLLACFVVIGIVSILRGSMAQTEVSQVGTGRQTEARRTVCGGTASNRWLVFAYLFACVSYFFTAGTDGGIKHVLGGFWYTDEHRLAANMALFAIPLAAMGAYATLMWVRKVYSGQRATEVRISHPWNAQTAARAHHLPPFDHSGGLRICECTIGVALCVILIYFPSISNGHTPIITTPIGTITQTLHSLNDPRRRNILEPSEKDFLETVREYLPQDTLFINAPNDGSGYIYGLYGMRTMYRQFSAPEKLSDETWEGHVIRTQLCDIATNERVRQAVEKTGARYVIKLDLGRDAKETGRSFEYYYPAQWRGIEKLDDDTPGFRVVLSSGPMRLYEIM